MKTKLLILFFIGCLIFSSCSLIFMGGGNIRISSNPTGAEVYRNGKKLSKVTPCKIKGKRKVCKVELKKSGYTNETLIFTRKTSPLYSGIAYVWAIPLYWPAVPFIPIDIAFGGTKIYYKNYDLSKLATKIWGEKNVSTAYLTSNPNLIDFSKNYDLSYPFYPKEYDTPKKIEKKLQSCQIYNVDEKKYKDGRWSGKITDGYAEGYGIGFYDTYNNVSKKNYTYGGKVEGTLSKGKPDGYCDVIQTTYLVLKNEKNDPFFEKPYFYYRNSGKYTNGLRDGEFMTSNSQEIPMGPIKNVKYFIIKWKDGVQVGDGFLFNKNADVIARGTTTNGRLIIEKDDSEDLKTIITIVGVTVGAKILLDKGIEYLQDYYAKYGYHGSSSSSSSSNTSSSNTTSSNTSTDCFKLIEKITDNYFCGTKIDTTYKFKCIKSDLTYSVFWWIGGDGGDKISNCVFNKTKGWRTDEVTIDGHIDVPDNATWETAAKKKCGCEK